MRSSGDASRLLAAIAAGTLAIGLAAQDADGVYAELLARERELRLALELAPQRRARPPGEASIALLRRVRSLTSDYEGVARLHARRDRAADALWQGAILAADAFWQFGDVRDRASAVRLFERLNARHPSSPLRARTRDHLARLTGTTGTTGATLLALRHEALRDVLRVTLDLDGDVAFRAQRTRTPPRLLLELPGTRAADGLAEGSIAFAEEGVRLAHIVPQPGNALLVELDVDGTARHAAYSLANPHRIVVDVERRIAPGTTAVDPQRLTPFEDAGASPDEDQGTAPRPAGASPAGGRAGSNRASAGVSLSRQLGLGIARIVIDPGHGGHDPGARARALHESEVVLDVSLRLERLLMSEPGVEVTLTRRDNRYVSLEDRTAIANRAGADLFLSIHVNASDDASVRGLETYVLNFAPTPEAEAIAARENSGSARTMASLPGIVEAIARHDRLDESRRFAGVIHGAMYSHVSRRHRETRDLGVKQAPFMVLVGATMPSALVEVAFLTHTEEAALLGTPGYRQQIAEALFAGIVEYQRSLRPPQAAM